MSTKVGISYIQSNTTPPSAILGDEWYNTSNGKTYKYMFYNNLVQWLELPSFASTTLSYWSTLTRPNNPNNGNFGYNTDLNQLEFYSPGGWVAI
jgi:hypothetical protein